MEENKLSNGTSRETNEKDVFGFIVGKTKSFFAHAIYKQAREMRGEGSSIVNAVWNTKRQTYYDTFNELRGRKGKRFKGSPIAGKDASGNMFILKSKLSEEQKNICESFVLEYGNKLD